MSRQMDVQWYVVIQIELVNCAIPLYVIGYVNEKCCRLQEKDKLLNKTVVQKQRYDLDDRWKQGVYVGPSSDVQHGQVVRFKDGGYVTSVHMRPRLIACEDLVELEPLEITLPAPTTRIRSKRTLAPDVKMVKDLAPTTRRRIVGKGRAGALSAVALKSLSVEEERIESRAMDLLRNRTLTRSGLRQIYQLMKGMFEKDGPDDPVTKISTWYTGAYVCEGVLGLRTNVRKMPCCSKFLPWPFRTSQTSVSSTALAWLVVFPTVTTRRLTLDQLQSTSS